ncbi:hypothetical protein SAMN04488058_101473 [Deinococcus reticulitermitis]|uniref:DUF4097 domain-containing protein n=1 Tax=Deinococcus reticulitermitis TaxID=856736 RepID=A0A1H6T2T4_9DEIO|nr:DUF4097 domain-containing protein [Deinococcus reticulitermitis]SEI73546.1 hypothetical protein SAMN04488058_101473 [Deinococcus reticulitermitis]
MKRAQAGWVSASVRADPTRPRPLLPVLARMSLGLGLALCGAALLWQGSTLRPIPGLVVSRTPFSVPLDGKLPLDLATSAALRFGSDRGSLTLGPLPPGSPELLSGAAKHRARNPLSLDTRRLGHDVRFGAWLAVSDPYERGTVTVSDPQPVQHELTARLSPEVPLTLSTETSVGAQTLDLTGLRLRGVTVRSDRGDLRLRLPGRPGGPYAVITRAGSVTVRASPGAAPEALRVNARAGDLDLDLGGARIEALGVGNLSGDVTLTLPAQFSRGSVTTTTGDVSVTARPGTRGNLDLRTQGGAVTLRLPKTLRTRVRFTDRDTLLLPEGTPPATAPALDLFVDAPEENFRLVETD